MGGAHRDPPPTALNLCPNLYFHRRYPCRLRHHKDSFTFLSWVGFMSTGREATAYYLDDVRLSVKE